MNMENYLSLTKLSIHYEIEISFIHSIHDQGLIQIEIFEDGPYISHDQLLLLEKVLRVYQELEVNIAGVDVILNLLDRIEDLQSQLLETRNKLSVYES